MYRSAPTTSLSYLTVRPRPPSPYPLLRRYIKATFVAVVVGVCWNAHQDQHV